MSSSQYRDYVETVRDANPIREVAAEYADVGKDGFALCLFHASDSRPSLLFGGNFEVYRCFGCGATGDVFRLVSHVEGVDFQEAVRRLAARGGVAPYMPTPQQLAELDRARLQEDVTDALARHYQTQLDGEPLSYLTDRRGLPDSTISDLLLGWANGTGQSVIQAEFGAEGLDALVSAGLATDLRNAMTWGPAARYREILFERITFPVIRRDRAVFLSGRTTAADVMPKYLHQRGREAPLYNEMALNPTRIFVVEGPIDAASLHAWSYPVVALQGGMRMSVAPRLQRPKLKYLVLDPDPAGRLSTLKAAAALDLRTTRVIHLPDGLDPNDFYLKRSREDFERLVAEALDPISWWLALTPTEPLDEPAHMGPLFQLLSTLAKFEADTYIETLIRKRLDWSSRRVRAAQETVDELRAGGSTQCPRCGAGFVIERSRGRR